MSKLLETKISNIPNRLKANNINTTAIIKFIYGFEANLFNPLAPKRSAIKKPAILNERIIPREYKSASITGFACSASCRFVKYETVIGINGNTQGVRRDNNPKLNDRDK